MKTAIAVASNIIPFIRKANQPSQLTHWQMTKCRHAAMLPLVVVGCFWETYWTTWVEVFRIRE